MTKHKNKHYKGFIEDAYDNILEYDADLLRIVSVNKKVEDTTDIVIAPIKVDKESIDELVSTIDYSFNKFYFTLPKDNWTPDVQILWTLDGTEFAKKSKGKYAEPRDYNILGVELKYDMGTNSFITPDGEHHSPFHDYGLLGVGHLFDDKGNPCLQELYNYVVEYKLDKLITEQLITTQSPVEEL